MAESANPPRRAFDRFPTTRVSLVLAAKGSDSQARDALADLCRIYWYPLYAYIRRRGYVAEDAQDLTQGFIARLLEKRTLGEFKQERGRFRSFLLASLKNFLANERDSAGAQKRGSGVPPLSLEGITESGEHRYRLEPRDDLTPEKVYEKQWAHALLNQVIQRLRDEFDSAGKGAQFRVLQRFLTGDDTAVRYRQIAGDLDMSEGAVKVAIHRMRQRFRDCLGEEISATVVRADEASDEIRYLMSVIKA